MKFTKMQGIGNDFVVIENSDIRRDWAQMAIAVCDRHYGIGADGLLILLPSDVADFRMRTFNADGTEADACGNGLRCLVKYFADNGFTKLRDHEIMVETVAGIRRAEIYETDSKVTKVKTGMGAPKFGADDIPVSIRHSEGKILDINTMMACSITVDGNKLELNPVSMGNPHAVYFSEEPVSDFPLSRLGPKVEKHKIFPIGVNFEIAQVLDRQHIETRVWERGVGETLACGSGACAITAAARLRGYIDNKVNIKLLGGILEVEWDGVGEVFMTGPVATVFTGEWPDGNVS